MKTVRRKGPLLAMGSLLICGGVAIGALASSLTSSAIVWRAAPRFPVTETVAQTAVDQAGAGQAWARAAFDGGLRQCPHMNAEFLAACHAEMKALMARPAFASGSYGGPLLITKIEPPGLEPYRPEEPAGGDLQPTIDAPEPPALAVDVAAEVTPENYPAAPQPY